MPDRSTRAKLIAAVDKLFRRGDDVRSLREVARAAGVTTGAVYSQFEDRNDLAVAAALERSLLLSRLCNRDGTIEGTAVRGDLLLDALVLVRSDRRRAKALRQGIINLLEGDEERIARLAVLLGVAALGAVGLAIDQAHLSTAGASAAARRPVPRIER